MREEVLVCFATSPGGFGEKGSLKVDPKNVEGPGSGLVLVLVLVIRTWSGLVWGAGTRSGATTRGTKYFSVRAPLRWPFGSVPVEAREKERGQKNGGHTGAHTHTRTHTTQIDDEKEKKGARWVFDK